MVAQRVFWMGGIAVMIVLLAVTLPYIYATETAGDSHEFSGFLFNPMDGNSYLAKMYQGWEGSWMFTLPYTADPGEGAYLFMFYLFLGHLARILGSSLLLVYHAARIVSLLFMLLSIYRFCHALLTESRLKWLAFALAGLGGGLGWMALPFGAITSDFWVAEAYPFLSGYANPHFPLALGLLLWVLTPPRTSNTTASIRWSWSYLVKTWTTVPLAFALALISPFAVILALVVLAGTVGIGLVSRRIGSGIYIYASRMVWIAAMGVPVLVYDQWATLTSPQLNAWNYQNVTPAPPVWDVLISFSPVLLLALLGAWRLWKDRQRIEPESVNAWLVPLLWAGLGLLLLYLPFNLQRRFVIGLYIPLCLLGVWGLDLIAGNNQRRFTLLAGMLIILVLPTNMLVIMAARHGVQQLDPMLFLRVGEVEAFQWLRQHAESDALVLASPRTGLFIPAYTGMRVVYGHPFETVQANTQKQAVEEFYSGLWNEARALEFLNVQGVDYIYSGPDERALGEIPVSGLTPVFDIGDVTIYKTPHAASGAFRLLYHGQVR